LHPGGGSSGAASERMQFIAACRESITSGKAPLRAILMRSLMAASVPWIQHEPQYLRHRGDLFP